MTTLLDSSVLIALAVPEHVRHNQAESWFAAESGTPFATCPITQGALVRLVIREGKRATRALALLSIMTQHERHEFWTDDLDYGQVRMSGVIGHRQVTDAYLAELARRHGGRLATFDKGVAALHKDVVELVPV